MAYSFCGFIGLKAPLHTLTSRYSNATIIELPQNMFVIPLVDELLSEMNEATSSESVDGFEYLSKRVEAVAIQASRAGTIAYAEVLTSAGEGDQDGIIWDHGVQISMISNEEVINSIFRYFGVVASKGQDEFLTMGFGLRRFTNDWLTA